MKNLSRHTDILCALETSLLMRGIHIGEMSKLDWLIGLIKHTIWADSLYFLHLLLLLNFQNPCIIPAYSMALFIGMLD
jgi:hypothetical protein